MIELDNVSRSYQDGPRLVEALRHITLRVERGSSVALTGKSGSGKSTLLHLMGGLEWPSEGRITVDGRDLGRLGDAQLTRFRLTRIGFVFQFFHLLPALTVLENLTLPAELAGLSRSLAREKAAAELEAVELPGRMATLPQRLSGGEQQRVAIARSLMLDPPLLLADEPTGNLDSETGQLVLELLFSLAERRGTTVVVATHSQELAARAARRIALRDGRLEHDSDGSGRPAARPGGGAAPGTP